MTGRGPPRPSAADDDLAYASVAELSRRIRAGSVSPGELADASLRRAEALGPSLGCFVTVSAERARADARAAERDAAAGRWRGPLLGIPCGLEDLVDTKGIRTTFGARPFAGRIPERDAVVATRLAEAGAVLAGKLSTIELGGALGYGTAAASISGPCRTPWDLARWAGGAASGPAAAVAAGIVPFALAADRWSSTSCPAAFCGVTAVRPTYGVTPRRGVMPVAYTMDRLAPVARSAQDCALVLAAIAARDPEDPTSIAPPPGLDRVRPGIARGLRIGVVALAGSPAPLPGAADTYAAAREVLREAGALLEPAALPDLPCDAAASLVVEAEAANALEDVIRSGKTRELDDPAQRGRRPDDYVPRASSADYVRAQRVRREIQRALAALFERHDLLLAPNLPIAPPRLDEPLGPTLAAAGDGIAAAASLAGVPAVALPMGFSGPLPLSMQILAPPLEEVRALSAAALFQARTSHHLERPKLAGPAVASAR